MLQPSLGSGLNFFSRFLIIVREINYFFTNLDFVGQRWHKRYYLYNVKIQERARRRTCGKSIVNDKWNEEAMIFCSHTSGYISCGFTFYWFYFCIENKRQSNLNAFTPIKLYINYIARIKKKNSSLYLEALQITAII